MKNRILILLFSALLLNTAQAAEETKSDTLQYPADFIPVSKDIVYSCTSEDGKMAFYSWNTGMGGSMKTVFPVADSSCTIPPILRLSAGATGITRRPSRIVGDASFSTSPLAVFRLGAMKRVPVIDITSVFLEKKNYSDYICKDGIHPNEKGHGLIEDAILKFMQEQRVALQ